VVVCPKKGGKIRPRPAWPALAGSQTMVAIVLVCEVHPVRAGGGSPDGGQRASGESHAGRPRPPASVSAVCPRASPRRRQPERSGEPGLDAGALRHYIASRSRREPGKQWARGRPSSPALGSGPTPAREDAQRGALTSPHGAGRGGIATLPTGAKRLAEPPPGVWGREEPTARAKPVPSFSAPWGADR
jgi:hypothetical protein